MGNEEGKQKCSTLQHACVYVWYALHGHVHAQTPTGKVACLTQRGVKGGRGKAEGKSILHVGQPNYSENGDSLKKTMQAVQAHPPQ
jgi:hypothetical protein